MHWLGEAASRAGLKGGSGLSIPPGTPVSEAWEIAARATGVTPSELAGKVAPAISVAAANFTMGDPHAVRLLPEKIARRYNVFPLREDDRQLVVATSDPTNLDAEQAVGFAAGRRVVFELAPPHAISSAIATAYSSDGISEALLSEMDAKVADEVRILEELKPEKLQAREVEAAPVVKLTSMVLRDAVLQRASDVHIEPGEGGGAVRFRVDGVMRQYMALPMAALNRVVSRIKVIARLDIADRLRPQDGRTRIQVEGKTYDLRISTVPIRDSEKAVIRVLRPDTSASLDEVDLPAPELGRLRRLLEHRDGIVLVTGPTGSGKTTTLYAALRELAEGTVNITTVEDPVEYELKGIAQIQVDPKRGVTFASALRAVLRQDPDVIFVGEIRDTETAEIAVQAAMTGHLVLATLHTNDAIGAIARLVDLGLDRSLIAEAVRGALAQRRVRRTCAECRGKGCDRCGKTGFYGRLPVVEVAVFTQEMADLIGQGAGSTALQRAAIAGGMRTLREAAVDRVQRGDTTAEEVERVLGGTKEAKTEPVVFVADDDPVQRVLISSVLRKNGFQAVDASDGMAALTRITSGEECALLVTDLEMPVMTGDELIRQLRANPRTRALPIIVVTSSNDEARESQLIDLGADDYLRKPLEPTRLVARVKAALRRASS